MRALHRLACLALVTVVACSGQDPGVHVPTAEEIAHGLAFPEVPVAVQLNEKVASIVESLTGALGVKIGQRALVLSLDAGWSISQVAKAITDERLAADGVIEAVAGGIEPPEGTPLGRFADLVLGLRAVAADDRLDAFIAALTEATDAVELNPEVVAAAADSMVRLEVAGYPLAQVLDHIPGGYILTRPDDTAVLFDAQGAFVCPTGLEGDIDCAALGAEWSEVAPDVLPADVFDGGTPSTDASTPDSPPVALGQVCVTGKATYVEESLVESISRDDFGACFPGEGGPVTGSIDYVAVVSDSGCTADFAVAATLAGDYEPPSAVGGTATLRASLVITSGDCALLVDGTTTIESTWSVSFDGTTVSGGLLDDQGASAFFLTGSVP